MLIIKHIKSVDVEIPSTEEYLDTCWKRESKEYREHVVKQWKMSRKKSGTFYDLYSLLQTYACPTDELKK